MDGIQAKSELEWERTRPACRGGRLAQSGVPQSAFSATEESLWNEVFGRPPKTARQRRAFPGAVKISLPTGVLSNASGGFLGFEKNPKKPL